MLFIGSGSLQRRLTITYTAALAIGLMIFAFLSLATIDRTLENALDSRLATTIRAFAVTAAGHVAGSRVDSATAHRLIHELGIQQNGAILTRGGEIAMESVNVPAPVARVAQHATGAEISYATVPGEGGLRVAALPIPTSFSDAAAFERRDEEAVTAFRGFTRSWWCSVPPEMIVTLTTPSRFMSRLVDCRLARRKGAVQVHGDEGLFIISYR